MTNLLIQSIRDLNFNSNWFKKIIIRFIFVDFIKTKLLKL